MTVKISVRIELSADALEAIMRPVAGSGGFQNLFRTLQSNVGTGQILDLTPKLIEQISHYGRTNNGYGGFSGST